MARHARSLPGAPEAVIVVARSGRQLAAAARAAGMAAHVVDLCGDSDTAALATTLRRLPANADFAFDGRRVLAALAALERRAGAMPVVLGSGFEHCPELVAAVAERHRLCGSGAGVIAALADRPRVLARLARAGCAVPATRRQRPRRPTDWLAKRNGASGGLHVQDAVAAVDGPDTYYQRRVSGASVSALYLVDAARCRLVGLHAHLAWHRPAGAPWRYEGALTVTTPDLARQARDIGRRVAQVLPLRGLFGLDFLQREEGLVLVDINPRPPATLELHATAGLLFAAHCRSGATRLRLPPERGVRGHLLLYAERAWRVPAGIPWPPWLHDRPRAGTRIAAGQPLCTLSARGHAAATVVPRLAGRLRAAQRLLGGASGPLPAAFTLTFPGEP